jgi:hypothetical protein
MENRGAMIFLKVLCYLNEAVTLRDLDGQPKINYLKKSSLSKVA